MADRRTFLTRLGVTGLLLTSNSIDAASAQTQPPASTAMPVASESPLASASASASPGLKIKPPSAVAVAVAATMLRFDPKLTDDELAKIAAEIDENAGAGAALNSKKRRLKNSDEPATRFAASVR